MRAVFVIFLLVGASPAGAGASNVGSWSVLDFETDGRSVTTLVLEDKLKSVKLICSTGEWSVYVDRIPAEDEHEYAFTEFRLAFRGVDGVRRTLPGDGQEGRTWQSVHATDFVAALASGPRLTYELGDGKPRTVAAKGTAEAIKPFLARCPLDLR